MPYSVDRIEDGRVVLVDGERRERTVRADCFDEPPREGDCVVAHSGRYRRSERSTKQLRDEVNALLDSLLERG
ncbi:MAG: DUF3006 domain-containing protein [Oscillospiraceae bacterium]|nr:DUF3006 domain-containing protein [Oscillospiraceae bacterium]